MPRPRCAIVYNAAFASLPAAVNPDLPLSTCVAALRASHERVLKARGEGLPARRLAESLASLRLAEACLEKAELIRRAPAHPLQIAVIGPTQSGKSSLVNLLLGEGRARVSPLAGYTVHPQGFPLNTDASALAWLEAYFHGYRRCRPDELPPDRYDYFALGENIARPGHRLPPSVVWDTPDFDSVDAADYRNAVLRTAALADVLVLVVSKDKYADQSVWETMALLAPLAQPTVVCLNKLNAGSQETLIRSLREKWRSARQDAPAPAVALPWIESADGALPLLEGEALAAELLGVISALDRAGYPQRARRLIAGHWQEWLAPIQQELEARDEWESLVDAALEEALSVYRRDYLNHPHHYETFQRALAELLTLLEIPGLAGGIAAARKFVTWPARQIARLGKHLRGQESPGQETLVIQRTVDHLFIQLGQALLDKSGDAALAAYWRELGRLLRQEREAGEAGRTAALAAHVEAFTPEIERTARQLLDKLREQPAVLNSLRATRATTDAIALALALHTGGIGPQDFIIAPAILSVTSLLTESALGRYVHKAEAELKERQFRAAEQLFKAQLRPALAGLPGLLDPGGRFNIPAQVLEDAEATLWSS